MPKHIKPGVPGEEAFVDMEHYFKKDKRNKKLEEKKMRKLLKEIQEAESYTDDDFDEDLEEFTREHYHRDED